MSLAEVDELNAKEPEQFKEKLAQCQSSLCKSLHDILQENIISGEIDYLILELPKKDGLDVGYSADLMSKELMPYMI